MHGRVILAVVAAVAAAAVSTTATASTTHAAAGARVDLATAAAAAGYLRSLGLDPRGFVVQRGAHNYAGPRCPGAGWTCTTARRVLQVSTRSTDDNDFVCSPSTSTGPDACVIVQTAAGSDNVAVCTERSGARDRTQTCDVTQTNTTGANTVTVRQSLVPHGSGAATQSTTVTQTSTAGANGIDLAQSIAQDDNSGTGSVAMTQTGSQDFELTQTSLSGPNTAVLAQSIGQTQTAKHATSGSQSQSADLKGHVEQHSTGLSTVTVGQSESQTQLSAGGVAQTQTGPMDCCSSQDTNPGDTFSITQTATHEQSPGGSSSETESAHFTSTGSGTATQTYNGNSTTQSGSVIDSTQTCSGGECTVAQPPESVLIAGTGDLGNTQPNDNLAQALTGAGYDVTESATLPSDLSSFGQVWWVDTSPPSSAQQDQLVAFAESGRGLYLTGERPCCESLNAADTTMIDSLVAGAVTAGGQGDVCSCEGPLPVNSGVVGTLATQPFSIASFYPDAPGGLANVPASSIFAYYQPEETATQQVVAAAWDRSSVVGDGRLVVLMDINWAEGFEPGSNWQEVAQNIAFFLSGLSAPPGGAVAGGAPSSSPSFVAPEAGAPTRGRH